MGYDVILRVASADPYRYKFINMRWTAIGESEINQNEAKQLFRHPSSPSCGSFWMKKPISFKSIKITHSPVSKNGNVSLLYMTMQIHLLSNLVVSTLDKFIMLKVRNSRIMFSSQLI